MQSSVLRYLSLLFVLATLSCLQAAPSADKQTVEQSSPKAEQLVRVYPINEEQYEKLLKLTNGKNLISEARLTSAGFTAVRNSLDNGWNSLLRIIGLTTTSRSEQSKIDFDGQPLCVMKRSLSDAVVDATEPRALETKELSDEDSVINCIVVLKKDPAIESQSAVNNPSFAPYWYHENNAAVVPEQELPIEPQTNEPVAPAVAEPVSIAAESNKEQLVATTTPAPKVNKPKPKTRSKSKSKVQKKKSDAGASREYNPYGLPPPPLPPTLYGSSYGSPYGGGYPYGGFNQNPYDGFNPYGSFGNQPGYGQFPPSIGQPPLYPSSPYYRPPPPPFNPYQFYEQTAALEEEEDEDEEAYEVDGDVDGSYENEYYH
ncbi:uncharacterized protein LOC117566566 [Drosophila albomicans]|uniref:Uncharacterized protein LOC117566566 n=1 Tax=Drosophila albomicans TaxID=7291 RepID=A0A6P8WRN7_DROAB|nr:uncharacterized protein LOC117566566 [Drosophila albomicans]